MTVESRVKILVGEVRNEDPNTVDLGSPVAGSTDVPKLIGRITEEFGPGVLRELIPRQIMTVKDLIDAILPAMQAGPKICTCSRCDYAGPGSTGADCPNCPDGKLTCKVY